MKFRLVPAALSIVLFTGIWVGRCDAAPDSLSLAGTWRVRLGGPNSHGELKEIRLPGTLDDAGIGPRNIKKPGLDGPFRRYDYAGPAIYQRDIEIPASWQGKRVVLSMERCRWVTTVWLDDRRIGSQDSLIAPHVYDFGVGVTAGKHRLVVCVDNTVKIELGTFVSALFGGTPGNMNGMIGRIALTATPPVFIDDVQVYPDVDKMNAKVVVRIGNSTGVPGHGTLMVGNKATRANWDRTGGMSETVVTMAGAKLWDEFHPNLQGINVKLGGDQRTVQFGMRKFAAKGTQFTMNDRPLFLRGTLECSVWPLTGYPPTDVASWRRICQIVKSYGLNYIRFHSYCPPDAAFDAADLEGVMIQAEGPMANVDAGVDVARDTFIQSEFNRMVDHYGNHPSFCTMTLGNEYGGNVNLLQRWLDDLMFRDPRHLYSSPTTNPVANCQFTENMFGRGIFGPDTVHDSRSWIAHEDRPPIGHEIGQWMFFPDFNEIAKYTGVMTLKNFEIIRNDMREKHLLELAPKFVEACGNQALLLYKEEVENLLRTPGFAGFSLLDLHDYPTQGTALVGLLDEFWDSKGFVTPKAFRRFCGPTVPLLRLPKRVYTSDESLTGSVDVSHFGPKDIERTMPTWRISDSHDRVIASGKLQESSVPTGKLTTLGTFSASLAGASTPEKLTVTVTVCEFSNDWSIWVYPSKQPVRVPAKIVLTTSWNDETKTALSAGKPVLLFPKNLSSARSLHGSFLPVFWSPVWFPTQKPNANGILCDPSHPIFAQFPTSSFSDWQWWDLLNNSRSLILDEAPSDFHPIIQVIDNFARNHRLGNLFEARVGEGKLLVCTIDLPGLSEKDPAVRQLLTSLYSYIGGEGFHPAKVLDLRTLDALLVENRPTHLQALGATVHADSEEPGLEAKNLMDGDPDTFWHTLWQPTPTPMPHEVVFEFPKPVTIFGLSYLPRQDMSNGRIAECKIYADDKLEATLKWPDTNALQTVRFVREVTIRKLRLAITSEVHGHPFASIAELDVLLR